MVTGVITLSAIAPNAFIAIDKLFFRKPGKRQFSRKEKEHKLAQTFYYLKKSGMIIMKPTTKDFKIYLTSLGKRKMREITFQTLQVQKPKIWDKKWWQVAADIPTKKHKIGADMLRRKLKAMKFYPLQRTLWFYPYDPRVEIEYVAKYYDVARFVTTMEINRLDYEDEQRMLKFFQGEKILQ